MVGAIGGGPQIVRNAAPIFRAGEVFTTKQLGPRAPRSAVGQLRDGRILLVAVDGRQPGYSVGLTNWELAQALVRLGAVTGMALDSGGSTTMAFDGQLLNRPSDGVERRISTGLAFLYRGVFAPEPPARVSPNGDGVDDTPNLAYRVVRPSSVTVTLRAPDGSTPVSTTAQQAPGTYPVPFPAAPEAGDRRGRRSRGRGRVDVRGEGRGRHRTELRDDPQLRRRRHARVSPRAEAARRAARRPRDPDHVQARALRARRR